MLLRYYFSFLLFELFEGREVEVGGRGGGGGGGGGGAVQVGVLSIGMVLLLTDLLCASALPVKMCKNNCVTICLSI